MSTNVKCVGYYIKLEQTNVLEIAKKLDLLSQLGSDEDNKYYLYLDGNNLNKWQFATDYNGDVGLIWLTEYEYDCFDTAISYEVDAKKNKPRKPLKNLNVPRYFYINYYNGSENPLIFK